MLEEAWVASHLFLIFGINGQGFVKLEFFHIFVHMRFFVFFFCVRLISTLVVLHV